MPRVFASEPRGFHLPRGRRRAGEDTLSKRTNEWQSFPSHIAFVRGLLHALGMNDDIRLARAVDLDAVEEVVVSAYSPYVLRIGRKPGPMLDNYAALIADERVHVAERQGAIAGLVVLLPQDDAMLLDNVAVRPEFHGHGVGKALLMFAEAAAREAGYGLIRLYTHEAMAENIALYSRIGYCETHRAEEKGFRRIYMAKPLH